MDYLITNATEIMQLCFGFGFLILIYFAVRPIIVITRLLKKCDDLTNIFIQYIQKPLQIIIKAHEVVSGVFKFMKK